PHPELFLEYPRGLGMDLTRFEQVELLPAAHAYRALIDETTLNRGWEVAAAVTTLFLEGTADERRELEADRPHSPAPLEDHPLVRHYGLPLEHLALTKAHRQVESGHRVSAWRVILKFVDAKARAGVVDSMQEVRLAFARYRDEVA